MIKPSLLTKLQTLVYRHEELKRLLSDQEVISSPQRFRDLSKEYSGLEELVNCYNDYQNTTSAVKDSEALLADPDEEVRTLAVDELEHLKKHLEDLEIDLTALLLPKDPNDQLNVFLEIRAAAGGDEAAIFAGDLMRMYSKFAEKKGWQVEVVSEHAAEKGGYKEIIARIQGKNVYSQLKFESGAHRVQRVPVTEAQGRIHTSTCTVAILPEIEEVDNITINPAELRIDTYRSSGAGGQHVNKTESAIRITHIPTGVVVECQDERSQHKNRARAMSLLQAKLLDAERSKQQQELTETRRNLVGTGDRSERIRTYNYPQGRVTDHRINLTLYKLEEVMEGSLTDIIEPLVREHQADLLTLAASE